VARVKDTVPPRPVTIDDLKVKATVHVWCGQVDDPARGYPCPCRRAREGR
jgi:hypothetical protein